MRFHRRAQSADRGNRQRQIHRGGRARPAIGRPRLGRNGSCRSRTRADLRRLRDLSLAALLKLLEARRSRDRRQRAADRARNSGERQIASLRRKSPRHRRAAERTGPASGRYSRPARSAAAFFDRRAARNAGRFRGRASELARSRGAISGAGARRSRDLRRTGSHRAGEATAGRSVDVPAQGNRGRNARSRARMPSSKTSAACCATWFVWRNPRTRPMRRCTKIRKAPPRSCGTVAKRLEELARIDRKHAEVVAALQPASIAVDEAAHALRHYLGKLEADPARLDEVESRLAAIEKLKRKYGATIDEVLAFLEDARTPACRGRTFERAPGALAKELARAAAAYESAAGEADRSRRRRRAPAGEASRSGTGFARHGKDACRDPRAAGTPGPTRAPTRSRF